MQGLLAGVLPIYLFARAVILLGAGRAATFPALVPGFSLIIGYLALGVVPSLAQLIGLVIVVIGSFALRYALHALPAIGKHFASVPDSRQQGGRFPARHICPRSAGTCS